MRILCLTITVFCLNFYIISQEFEQTNVDFTVKLYENNSTKLLSFQKNIDSLQYNILKFTLYPDDYLMKFQLNDQLEFIEKYWKQAENSINIDLSSIWVGYPTEYIDLLVDHVNAFINSEEWQNYVIESKKNNGRIIPDHKIIETVMYKYNSYKIIYSLLEKFNCEITGVSIEKVGFLREEDFSEESDLNKFDINRLKEIPIPYMVYLKVKKIN